MMKKVANKIIDENQCSVELISGQDMEGNSTYTYLLARKDMAEALREKIINEDVNIEDYGVVIAFGFGEEPPQELQEKIAMAYQ